MNFIHNNLFFIKNKHTVNFIMHNYGHHTLKYLLIISIVLITVIKLNLMGTGFLTFIDECRYYQSGMAFQHILELNVHCALKDIFSTQARPGDALIKIIPNAIQYITAHIFRLDYYESQNSYPLFFYNFMIYCCILIIHYKFSKLLLNDSVLALLSVLCFSTLTNSYLYLRHALPYDLSLLVYYLAIYKIALYTEDNSLSCKKSLVIGTCCFFGFMIYPGNYTLFIVVLFLLFFNNLSYNNFFMKLYYSGYYILGSVLCLVLVEKISRIAGPSYLLDAIGLSQTLNQGSYEESFLFIVKYLFEVEGLIGLIILISLVIFFIVMAYQIKNNTFKQYSLINLLGIILLLMYLAFASLGYFFHKAVFQGRYLHQYYPFICIFFIYVLNKIVITTRKYQLIFLSISLIFIINFCFNFKNYKSYTYPRDIIWQLIKTDSLNGEINKFEYDNQLLMMPKGSGLIYYNVKGEPITLYYNTVVWDPHNNAIYLINNLKKKSIFNSYDKYNLLESKPCYINFKAYQYDIGYNMFYRTSLSKMNIQIKIFAASDHITALSRNKKDIQ